MYESGDVLGAATAVGAGVAVLPATNSEVLSVLAVAAIIVGSIVLLSALATKIAVKVT